MTLSFFKANSLSWVSFSFVEVSFETDRLGQLSPACLHLQHPVRKLGCKVSCLRAIPAQIIKLPRVILALNEFPRILPENLPGTVLKEERSSRSIFSPEKVETRLTPSKRGRCFGYLAPSPANSMKVGTKSIRWQGSRQIELGAT